MVDEQGEVTRAPDPSGDPQPAPGTGPEQKARERIEEARSEAAAMIIQHPPNEHDQAAQIEERIAEVVHEAQAHPDAPPHELEKLAEQVETGRDELRDEFYGRQHTG